MMHTGHRLLIHEALQAASHTGTAGVEPIQHTVPSRQSNPLSFWYATMPSSTPMCMGTEEDRGVSSPYLYWSLLPNVMHHANMTMGTRNQNRTGPMLIIVFSLPTLGPLEAPTPPCSNNGPLCS